MNYDEVVAAATAYADRNDLEVANNLDTFIVLAEAKINRLLQTREQTARVYAPTIEGEEYYSLPPDYRSMRDLHVNSDLPYSPHTEYLFEYLSPRAFTERRSGEFTGVYYYTVIANQIQIYPVLDAGASLEMIYYQKVPNLNSVETENWLATEHPDIYVAAVVGEIETFVKNYEVAGMWFERMALAINELDNLDVKERWSGTPMRTRLG